VIRRLVTPWAVAAVAFVSIFITTVAIIDSTTTGFVAVAVACLLASAVDWAYLIGRGLSHRTKFSVTEDEIYAIADDDLPVYSIFVPVLNRPDDAESLLKSLTRLDYPADKLDIYIIVDATDEPTRSAFQSRPTPGIQLVTAPSGVLGTKASACNYALCLPGERGDYVTLFGVDDLPDPLQLRKAAYAFANASANVAVFQCKLTYFNDSRNLLTRWCAVERDRWSSFVLPALSRVDALVPLSPSSSHIRKSLLAEVGGWEPGLAVEEAEMAIRFSRNGYRILVLDSYTATKATTSIRNWLRRRSRWYLGYLQTLVGHSRNPIRMCRELGVLPVLRLFHLTAGWQLWCFANAVLWTAFICAFVTNPSGRSGSFFALVLLLSTANIIAVLTGVITTSAADKPHLTWAALLIPGYWILQAIEAVVTGLNFVWVWITSWSDRGPKSSDR
jgi:cellulose synthase/poly-beta-1,6-N-acetylglucosamine synthase-like glycosyltransferase